MGTLFHALLPYGALFFLGFLPAFAGGKDPSVAFAEKKIGAIKRAEELLDDPEIVRNGIFFTPENSRIVIFVPQENFGSAMKQGIRNLHQTANSKGFNAPYVRKDFENRVLQADIDAFPNSKMFRPKSGIVLHAITAGFVNPSDHYGSVAVVLKPEVFTRSLWTHGDSLEGASFEYDAFLPKPFSIPYDERVFPAIGASSGSGWNEISTYGEEAGKIAYEEGRYVEALVFGSLKTADIESVAFFPGTSAQAESIAKRHGIPSRRMKGRSLRTLLVDLRLPKEVGSIGTRPLLEKTIRAISKPSPFFWEDGRKRSTPTKPKKWIENFSRKYAALFELCERTPRDCPPYEVPKMEFEHPHMTSQEGMNLVGKLMLIQEKNHFPFASSLRDHYFIQPGVLGNDQGRALFDGFLKTLAPSTWTNTYTIEKLVRDLAEKPYFWTQAPDQAAKLVALAWKKSKQDPAILESIAHVLFGVVHHPYPETVLAERLKEWTSIKRAVNAIGADAKCKAWLRPFREKT